MVSTLASIGNAIGKEDYAILLGGFVFPPIWVVDGFTVLLDLVF